MAQIYPEENLLNKVKYFLGQSSGRFPFISVTRTNKSGGGQILSVLTPIEQQCNISNAPVFPAELSNHQN